MQEGGDLGAEGACRPGGSATWEAAAGGVWDPAGAGGGGAGGGVTFVQVAPFRTE